MGYLGPGSLKTVGKYNISIIGAISRSDHTRSDKLILWIDRRPSGGRYTEVYHTKFKSPQIVIDTYRRLRSVKAIEDYLKHRIPKQRD